MLPCIVEANLPINESGPYVAIKSVVILKPAEPEIGRISAKGTISAGTWIKSNIGFITDIIASNAPEDRNIEIDTSIPTINGKMEIAI